MKTKRHLVESLLSLFFTLLLFVTTIFAWISLRPVVEVEEFVATIGEYKINTVLKVKKNEGSFVEVTTKEEMEVFFQDAVPNDRFEFQLEITNLSDYLINIDLRLMNVSSSTVDPAFNMLDVFFLEGGKVIIEQQEMIISDGDTEGTLIHNEIVHPFRFSYILGEESSLLMVQDLEVDVEGMVLIEFAIGYYWETENISYQEGIFSFDSIQINF